MPNSKGLREYYPSNAVSYDEEDGEARLKSVRERFDEMKNFWSVTHEEAREDDAFIAGHHWDDKVRKDREREGRPVLTYNLLPSFTRQIVNGIRQNRPQVRVKPVQSNRRQTPQMRNVQGTKDHSLSDVFQGLIRNIEHVSRAEHAYDNAVTHAVWHGFGYFTVNTKPSHSDPWVQDLVIERVKDSYGVYLDPMALQLDFSDMQDAFVFSRMTFEAFEKKYPDADTSGYNQSVEAGLFGGWFDKDSLQIATYWWVEHVPDEVVKMNDHSVHYLSDVEYILDEMAERGTYIMRDEHNEQVRKKVLRPKVKWQKHTALQFLTEETDTVFEQIPIFPVMGDEITVDGRTTYMSAIRDAKDPQKSYNYWRTAGVETVALAPKAPFILTKDQIKGREREWSQANKSTKPYLTYNFRENHPMPQRSQPPAPATAEMVQAQADEQAIQATIGLHDASLGRESNEKSGRAVLARQKQGSVSTYNFPANLERAMEAMGRVLVNAIPQIYDTRRIMRVRMPDDSEDFVEINVPEIDEDTSTTVLRNDLAYGKYDVVIDTGPSYATQREENIESMLELLNILPPESLVAVAHLIVREMAFPGADKVASVLRKMIPDQLKSEEDRAADLPKGVVFNEEGQPVNEDGTPYEPPLTPAMQVQQKANEIEEAKVQAEVAKAQGDQAMAQAKVEEAKAKIAKAQTDMAQAQAEAAQPQGEQEGPDINGMVGELREAIGEALRAHEENPAAHQEAVNEAQAEMLADVLPRVRRLIETEAATAVRNAVKSSQKKETA